MPSIVKSGFKFSLIKLIVFLTYIRILPQINNDKKGNYQGFSQNHLSLDP